MSGVANSIFVAPVAEEFLKFAAFMMAAYWSAEHNEPLDAMVCYISCGIGFAVAENFTFVVSGLVSSPVLPSSSAGVWLMIAAIRSFPGHALFGALAGYFAGRSRLVSSKARIWWLVATLVVAIGSHAVFNLIASVGLMSLLVLYLTGLAIIVLVLASEAAERSPRRPDSGTETLSIRKQRWKQAGKPESGPFVFALYFAISLALIFTLSYFTIWFLTWVT